MNLNRRNHVLRAKPMGKSVELHLLAFYDVETYVDKEGTHHPYLLCAKLFFTDRYYNVLEDETDMKLLWEDRHQFLDKLVEYASHSAVKVTAFAHNHQFDLGVNNGGNILAELKDEEEVVFLDKEEDGPSGRYIHAHSLLDMLTGDAYGYRIYQMSLKTPKFFELGKANAYVDGMLKYTKNSITFIDSMNYFPTKLSKIGESIGMQKGDLDHFIDRRGNEELIKEAFEYCMNDVSILAYAVIRFLMISSPNHKVPKSTPSAVFNLFTERYLNPTVPIYCHDKKKALKLELDSYMGARTEVYLQNKKEFIYSLDVNSLYPYVMRKFKYPTRIVSESTSISVGQQQKMIQPMYDIVKNKDNRTIIADVQLNIPKGLKVSPVPVRLVGERPRDTRLVFPTGEFTTTLAGPEFMLAVEKGYVKRIFAYVLYETNDIFSKFITDMYDARLKSSAEGMHYEADLYKMFMNSLAGKFGQNLRLKQYVGPANPDTKFAILHEGPNRDEVQVFGYSKFKYGEKALAYDAVPAIPAHVNSYARVHMWDLMEKAGFQNVLYIDNDGIKVTEEGYKNLQDEIDDKELGKLKFEYSGYLTAYVAKDYRIDEAKDSKGNYITDNRDGIEGVIVKMKGIPDNAVKVEEITGKEVYLKEKFSTAYDAMREGGMHNFRTEKVFVTRNLMLHGRVLSKDGHKTMPLELSAEFKSYGQHKKDKDREEKERKHIEQSKFDYSLDSKPKAISTDFRVRD